MKLREAIRRASNSTRKAQYRNLSLVKLVTEIVEKGDRGALEEFHIHRTLFRHRGGPPLLFIDYLNKLRESIARSTWVAAKTIEVAEKAFDLTIDKFNNIPDKKKSLLKAKSKINQKVKHKGPDCRFNFKAFLHHVANSFKTDPPANEIEEEARAAMIMQGLVRLHFNRSLLEAKRVLNPFWNRYNWESKGGTISIWLPIALEGRKRREWLEENVDDPNPLRPGERKRIQDIIDQKLLRERVVTLSEATDISSEEQSSTWSDSNKTFEVSLAEAVGEEKARNIDRQRPSIRALGKKKLNRLVLRIFEGISSGEYEDGKVARNFGLSKATFSRFAGSNWAQSGSAIPDLWLNTAEVLSTHPIFKEVAMSTGVWSQVQTTIERGTSNNGEEISHD